MLETSLASSIKQKAPLCGAFLLGGGNAVRLRRKYFE